MPPEYTLPQINPAKPPTVDDWRAETGSRLAAVERRCLWLMVSCVALTFFCLFLTVAHYFAVGSQAQSVADSVYADRIYTDQITIRSKKYGGGAIVLREDGDSGAAIAIKDVAGKDAVVITPHGVVKAD